MSLKSNKITVIPVDMTFARNLKIRASVMGISRLELTRIEAKKMNETMYPVYSTKKNEENKFPFRF